MERAVRQSKGAGLTLRENLDDLPVQQSMVLGKKPLPKIFS